MSSRLTERAEDRETVRACLTTEEAAAAAVLDRLVAPRRLGPVAAAIDGAIARRSAR